MKTFFEWLEDKKKAIILATGAFSPIHKGHIDMFKTARSYLESLGYEVIKGIISPKHNDYVSSKTSDFLDIDERIELIKNSIKDSALNWIEVYDWEARQSRPMEKKYVVNNIQKIHPQAEVFFVCGEDNCPLPSYPGIAKMDGFSWVSTGRDGFSSTRVRKAIKDGNHEDLDLMLYPSVKNHLLKKIIRH